MKITADYGQALEAPDGSPAARKSYLSAGIASAAERTSYSWSSICRERAQATDSALLTSTAGNRTSAREFRERNMSLKTWK
jgi:hypothetical protein